MTDNVPALVPPTDANAAATAPRLRGRWLVPARIAWVIVVLLGVAILVSGVPAFYNYARTPCTAQNQLTGCLTLSPAGFRAFQHLGISADGVAAIELAILLATSFVFIACGALIAWRRWDDGMGLFASLVLIAYGTTGSSNLIPPLTLVQPHFNPIWGAVVEIAIQALGVASWPAMGAFLLTFPTGRFVPRWSWLLISTWLATLLAFNLAAFNVSPPQFVVAASIVLQFGSVVAVQIYRYRRIYTPVEQQQTKWLVLSIVAAAVVSAVIGVIAPLILGAGALAGLFVVILGAFGNAIFFLPISLAITVALLRYRLYGIDVIIRRTLLYSSLTVILAAVYFGVVVGLQSLVTAVTHQTNPQPVIIVASTLLIAMLASPLRRQVQAGIDRRFYRAKYNAARTLQAFAATLRTETDLAELREHLVDVVRETMQPASVSLWLREPEKTPRGERTIGSD